MHDDNSFPSEIVEGHSYFVGISEHVGNAMTFKILTSDTNKIIYRSVVRSAESFDRNHRAEMGRDNNHSDDLPDRNITAPDSDHGESSPDYPTFTLSTDGETPKSIDEPYDETKHPAKVVTSRHDHVESSYHLCQL